MVLPDPMTEYAMGTSSEVVQNRSLGQGRLDDSVQMVGHRVAGRPQRRWWVESVAREQLSRR